MEEEEFKDPEELDSDGVGEPDDEEEGVGEVGKKKHLLDEEDVESLDDEIDDELDEPDEPYDDVNLT